MLVFLDLETEGLRANEHAILEVACIVTTDALEVVARYGCVLHSNTKFYELDEFVRDMHTKSGLWPEVVKSQVNNTSDVDHFLAKFIRENAVKLTTVTNDKGVTETKLERPQLAGNTISFDRAFMKVHFPNAEAELHYRMFDVTTLNEHARRFFPAVYEKRPRLSPSAAHRAMADCEDSLNVARYYAKELGPQVAGPEVSLHVYTDMAITLAGAGAVS